MSVQVPLMASSEELQQEKAKGLRYVLITPARNEGAYIASTIESMIHQNVLPLRWVIVSDGSTDNTDATVLKFAAEHPWIELLRMPERRERHFSGKVHAFMSGYERVRGLDFDAVGSIDADITFEPDFFEFLLARLEEDPRRGLVGAPFYEHGAPVYDFNYVNIEHVSGACQFFRRACFEQIGGYTPVKGGGIDHIAVVSARMKGWKTRTFTEKYYDHHRPMGTAQAGALKARFKLGTKDYALGNHPLWEFSRMLYQMTKRPLVLGGVMLFSGYLWSLMRGVERPISDELLAFTRREQMGRLSRFLTLRKKTHRTA